MENINLKCAIESSQIQNRLLYNPNRLELQLREKDMYDLDHVYETVRSLQYKGVQVVLHHPMSVRGHSLDILDENSTVSHFYRWTTRELIELCKQLKIKCVIHAHYAFTTSKDINDITIQNTYNEIEKIHKNDPGVLLWENSCYGVFTNQNEELLNKIIKPLGLNMCFDISHSFISLKGNNQKMQEILKEFSPHIQYFHVVDSKGLSHDALPLGEGHIDWKPILPFLENKPFIFEIGLKDFNNCEPMLQSVQFYNNLLKKSK